MANDPYAAFSVKQTSQSEPIPGSNQVHNSAGGYAFEVDKWSRLVRFLIIGSEGGSYYAAERELTAANATNLLDCIAEDGKRVVQIVREISLAGRAPKQQPAIFALAACAGASDVNVRRAALDALPEVCRIGTHLFLFMNYVKNFRGRGRTLQRALQAWYLDKDPAKLAYDVSKYQSRYGWSHRDVLRLAKPYGYDSQVHNEIFSWVTGKSNEVNFEYLDVVDRIKTLDGQELYNYIVEYNLPWEVLPTEQLNNPGVWAAMLPRMGMTAMIRNLNRMSANGLLTSSSDATKLVIERLRDGDALNKARVHPINVLMALSVYAAGHGAKGKMEWKPVPKIIDALNEAFYLAFGSVEPAGKRTLIGLDVSGSMGYGAFIDPRFGDGVFRNAIAGTGLTPRGGSAAMCMVHLRTEDAVDVMAFCDKFVPLGISGSQRLDDVVNSVSHLPFGRTDCAQPMLYAMKNNMEVDTFIVYTDSETWAGSIHPVQALRQYRDKTGIAAKLVVVGMVANEFSIADPSDGGMLDVVGFDAAAPAVINDFSAGR